MGIINVLDIHVANLIAAGEVVDRPASAVKELIENAIDAKADKITVEIKKGGSSFIRVCDNGKGMSREDVPVCIQRHATSKIKEQGDLGNIITLGFRGEALAAISSVSKIRIMTKRREDKTGTLMMCEPGAEVQLVETGCPDGTTVIVEELFANVPARRKFLKKDVTEGMAVSYIVEKLALSKPNIAFRFICDDTLRFSTAGDGKLANVIYALYGREFVKKMTAVEWKSEGINIYGYIGNPDNTKKNRNHQIVFVNDRFIRNKTVSAALEQAFDSYIPEGNFPCCVLKIEVHPAFVDANVHPTKAEVKFSDERLIFDSVYSTVRSALEYGLARPDLISAKEGESDVTVAESAKKQAGLDIINSFARVEERDDRRVSEKLSFTNEMNIETGFDKLVGGEREGSASTEKTEADRAASYNEKKSEDAFSLIEITTPKLTETEYKPVIADTVIDPLLSGEEQDDAEKDGKTLPDNMLDDNYGGRTESPSGKYVYDGEAQQVENGVELPFYRVIGEAFYSYIMVEMADKVLIIDKHAAHERMIFEELKSNMKKKKNVLQFLLVPVELTLDSVELSAVEEYCDDISAIGFEVGIEEKGRVLLYAIPVGLSAEAAADLFMTVVTRISQGTGSAELARDIVFEKALYQASCKAAIKAGRPDAAEDTKAFVKKLLSLPDIRYCPHGRPVAFELTKDALEKQFKRK